MAWLGWAGAGTRDELRLAAQQAVRVAELQGTIAHLDEWLTMSARMAAASGDARWIARYDEADPRLEAAIVEAVALATPAVGAELARTTDEANRRLVEMERASFARVAAGDLAGAASLLESREYADLKAVYASGIEVFGQDLSTLAAARTATVDDRAWMETSGLALGATFLVAAVLSSRGHARLRVARTDALTDLPNRRRLYEELQAALARLDRSGGGSRCCCSTSTGSRRSTTYTAIPPATTCCSSWPPGFVQPRVPATSSQGWAATSSP